MAAVVSSCDRRLKGKEWGRLVSRRLSTRLNRTSRFGADVPAFRFRLADGADEPHDSRNQQKSKYGIAIAGFRCGTSREQRVKTHRLLLSKMKYKQDTCGDYTSPRN